MKPGGCCRRDEMRLEEDFSKVYEAEMQELKEFCENHVNSPQEEAEKAEELEFIKKVAELTLLQYEHVFDEEKQKKILSLYHLLVKEASFRGGKVSLDIDDETMIACLEYAGREIVFTGDKMDESAKLFSILFQMMDNGSITAKNDIFTIQAMYQLYENKKVVDRKKEIEALYDEFDRKRGIIRTLPRPFLDDIL
jgi:hypothetical protein